jgi:hypothetical protein
MFAAALPAIGIKPLFEIVEPRCRPGTNVLSIRMWPSDSPEPQIEAEAKRIVVNVREFAAASEFGKAW